MQRGRFGILSGLLLACACAGSASAHGTDDTVPWVDGLLDAAMLDTDWTIDWWDWAQPAAEVPYFIFDDRICEKGPSGLLWFVDDDNGRFEAVHKCVVPEGKYLRLRVPRSPYESRALDDASALGAADGYWLMLKPLSRGHHTLSVGANYGATDSAYGGMTQNFEIELDVGGGVLLGIHANSRTAITSRLTVK